LGGLAVLRGDARVVGAAAQPRRLALLAMVARSGTRGISRDRLLEMLWPDADEEQGRNVLKQALYALRRDTDARELFLGSREIRLNTDEVDCDVVEFEQRIRDGDRVRAVALYEGPFLDGFRLSAAPAFELWMEEERTQLARTYADALEHLAATASASGDVAAAVGWSRRLAALEPLNARFAVGLMRALLAAGDRQGALQQARIHEALLDQELELPPDRDVVELARRIREDEIVVTAPPRAIPIAHPAPSPQAPAPAVPAPALALTAVAAAPSLAVLAAAATDAPPAPAMSVAVLPFTCMSSDVEVEHLCHGLTEELIHALVRGSDLRVPGRTASQAFAGHDVDLRDVGARLGVASLVEGSIRRSGDRIRVTARLIAARDGATRWNDRYDRRTDDLLALQDEIANAIAAQVDRVLRGAAGLPAAPTPRALADALHAQGREHWHHRGADVSRSLDCFRQAIAIDPDHGRAHAGLADAYMQLAFYGYLPARRAATLGHTAALRAVELEPLLAETHSTLGASLATFARDIPAARAELEHAIRLDDADATTRYRIAFLFLCAEGDEEAALPHARHAARLDGAATHAGVMLGMHLYATRRYDEAIDALHTAIDVEAPSFLAYHWLSATYIQQGDAASAVAAAVAEASISERHPWALANLAIACTKAGQRKRAEAMLAGLRAREAQSYVQSTLIALVLGAMGDIEGGVEQLGRSVDSHDPALLMLRTFPMFDCYRDHPSYPALLQRAGWR
jgi:TolB-like protein/DNA-binding SARP family transcriptional activator/Tfp pilus assembly protein PilF